MINSANKSVQLSWILTTFGVVILIVSSGYFSIQPSEPGLTASAAATTSLASIVQSCPPEDISVNTQAFSSGTTKVNFPKPLGSMCSQEPNTFFQTGETEVVCSRPDAPPCRPITVTVFNVCLSKDVGSPRTGGVSRRFFRFSTTGGRLLPPRVPYEYVNCSTGQRIRGTAGLTQTGSKYTLGFSGGRTVGSPVFAEVRGAATTIGTFGSGFAVLKFPTVSDRIDATLAGSRCECPIPGPLP